MSTETSCHFAHLLLEKCCQIKDDNSFWKIHCFTFFPYKSIRDKIWPCRKIGQGQPSHHLSKLDSTQAPKDAYQNSRSLAFWFRRRRLFRFLPYMGMAAILVMWPGPFEQTSVPHPIEAPYEIWLWLAQWFLRRCIKSVDNGRWRRMTYNRRRTTEAYLSYKLTKWAFGSGELKMYLCKLFSKDPIPLLNAFFHYSKCLEGPEYPRPASFLTV